MRPVKLNFSAGIILGVLLASGAVLAQRRYAAPSQHAKNGDDDARWWLLPKGFTLSQIYTDPDALSVLESPDTISIHRVGTGNVTVGGYTFATKGVSPAPDEAKSLLATLHALNAYSPPSACAFQPGVLVRLSRGEHQLDLLVCFTCNEIIWVLDGRSDSHRLPIGLSDIGVRTLRSIFRGTFPDDPVFKSQ